MENVLIKFLALMVLLFFLPKLIFRFTRIPYPLSEIFIGMTLGMTLPGFFFLDDMTGVMATLGIIMLFVYAGVEVEPNFMRKNLQFFIENAIRHIILFLVISVCVQKYFHLPLVEAMIVAIALTTPSASYILSAIHEASKQEKSWIVNKAISGELLALGMLIILLTIDNILKMVLILGAVIALVLFMPDFLRMLYSKLFSKLVGSEFPFIFIVALISAYITEYLGVHFLIGAFIAGFVMRRFVSELVLDKNYKHVTKSRGNAMLESFGYFASTFIPFYFFNVGLNFEKTFFQTEILLIALGMAMIISLVMGLSYGIHRWLRFKGSFKQALSREAKMIPTLVFTFVIAGILRRDYGLPDSLFGILLFYGLFTAVLGIILPKLISAGKKSLAQNIYK